GTQPTAGTFGRTGAGARKVSGAACDPKLVSSTELTNSGSRRPGLTCWRELLRIGGGSTGARAESEAGPGRCWHRRTGGPDLNRPRPPLCPRADLELAASHRAERLLRRVHRVRDLLLTEGEHRECRLELARRQVHARVEHRVEEP